ncbi:MAG: tRNA glutamyl-Q(34) synthetase GluQRS [Gemmatimonadota bacterium]
MRGRFAPSPTGDLHLGNARTALLAWLQVRRAGGRFVLRMEDLDPGRVRPEYQATQLEDLRWLGLEWDEGPDIGGDFGPYLQSSRQRLYEEALERLGARGRLYECLCSRREIAAAAEAPHAGDDEGPPYPGTCSRIAPARGVEGRPSALRFRVPPGPVGFEDELYGMRSYTPSLETGDFVVRRKDGVAAYQLAVVVDDAAMQITDVLRGADLLSSTARQILLYHALDLPEPRWTHVPLMLSVDGERLSKRSGAASLRELREQGAVSERVVGWLAWTCGLAADGKEVAPAELVADYDVGRLPREDTPVAIPDWLRGAGSE